MPNRADKFTRSLTAISEADDVITLREGVVASLALSDIREVFFVAPLTADPRIGRLLTNYGVSKIWERQYRARLHMIDPLPDISLKQSGAFSWPEVFKNVKLPDAQRRYLAIAAQYGLARGIGVACYGPNGRSGFLGAAWPFDDRPDEAVLQRVQFVGQASFNRYCQLIRSDSDIPALSNRELEVLSWMGEGKSNTVIAQILEISRSSVDIYVRRIFAKLGVTDRTAACLRAFSLGLTVTGDYQRMLAEAQRRAPGDAY